MLDTDIRVKLENFDGPLGLLLLLIEKEEMKIRDLDLTHITRQYLDYLSRMKELDFDLAGDHLLMAASLIYLKSQDCLNPEDKHDLGILGEMRDGVFLTKAELIRRLEELKHFQELGQRLWALPKKGHEIFAHPPINRKEIADSILTPVEVQKLLDAMMDLIRRNKKRYGIVKRDPVSLRNKIDALKNFLHEGERVPFETILENSSEKSISDLVLTFISLLELARLGKIGLFQNDNFGTIYIDVMESLANFDTSSAKGFEVKDHYAQAPIDDAITVADPKIIMPDDDSGHRQEH